MVVALVLVACFAVTNGLHDASNAIAMLVATRIATPAQAIVMASVLNLLGPLVVGAAVAETVGGLAAVDAGSAARVLGAAMGGAVVWNLLTWWRGLPSSSGHALVGGLVAAALADGGADAVTWGGLDGWRPVGVLGVLFALAISPLLGGVAAFAAIRVLRRIAARATNAWRPAVRGGTWAMSAALAFSHGANDTQKAVGVAAALLTAEGHLGGGGVPAWLILSVSVALTCGTAIGGWRIIRTVGRRIYRIQPLDALAGQGSAAAVIFGASLAGAPASTTQVVASSVVGLGAGRRRWHHVKWTVVREMAIAWVITMPAAGLLALAWLGLWGLVA